MSSRIRNSESQRGIKGETPPQSDIRERHPRPRKESHSSFRGVNPSRWSDVEANNATKNDDCSTWPSWDSSPVENNVKRDEGIGDTRHKNVAESAFDGRGRQHHSRPLDDSWSDPQRVRGSARSRSRSRDKDGSRSRSRSRSRSKGRDRGKGRSRSRSRSWDRGEGGGRGRSRSPFHDDRHESNENIDRVSGPRLPSRVCRDFATGKCRRGSNCRFLHHDNLNSQGGRHSDNDVTHRSSSRPEYEGASRYGDNGDSVDCMHDKVSDGSRRYSGKDEPDRTERSGSRPEHGGASRYGDNRTSAEDRLRNKVSDGTRRYNVEDEPVRDNHNRGNRNASYNHDNKGPPNRSGKVPCKYFLIGKCHREDCRFSHDAPLSEGVTVDGRSRDDRLGHNADEKKSWNGPTWDEVTPNLANSTKSTGLHDSSFHNLNSHDSTTYEKRADEKNKSWNGPTWDEVNASDLSDIAKSSMHENNVWNGMTWDETSVPGRKLDTPVMHAHVSKSSNRYGRDNPATFDDSNVLDVDMVSEDSTYPVVTPKQVFAQSDHSMSYQSPLNLGGNEQCPPTIPLNPLNRPNDNLSGSEGGIYPPLTQPIQTRINRNEVGEAQELPELGGRQVMPEMSGTVVSSEQVAQITDLPAILNQISQNGQLPQMIAALNPNNGMGLAHSIPTTSVPNSTKLVTGEVPSEKHQKSPKSNQQGPGASEEVKNVAEKIKREQEKNQAGSSDARGIVEEGSNGNDEKAMRLFKNALIDFVKEILKPTWKEGGMSREVHKTVVKKVVDKVTSTVQGIQIPRTPEKIEQYLAFSKSKITKLVAAYVERLSKAGDA